MNESFNPLTGRYCDRCVDEPPVYRIVDRYGEYYLCRTCKNSDKKLKKIKAK